MGHFIANVPTPCGTPPPCTFSFNPLQDTIKSCGDSVVLNAGSGFATYSWSNGDTTSSTTIHQTGKYYITVTNGAGCSASDSVFVSIINATIFNQDSIVISADTTIKYDSSLQLSVDSSKGFYLYDTLDFSNQFNNNVANSYGVANYKKIPTGNDTFIGIPFYIYPWTNTVNGWDAYKGIQNGSPNILSLNTHGYMTSAVDLLANTEWGKVNFTSVSVQFWSGGQIIYQKPLYGNVDLRDWNQNSNTTDTINNTTTVGIWNDGTHRLDKVRIALPSATNIDSILVVDSGWYNFNTFGIQQFIFVMAATLEGKQDNILLSTGQTTPSIQVTTL